jgi:hypothetical protein
MPLHLFIPFFLYWHLRMRGAQLVSQRERKVYCFYSSELPSSNTADAWHFEVEGMPSIALELRFGSTLWQD